VPVNISNIIDFISIDADNKAVLTISDHYDWKDSHDHLMMLQEKINGYLEFIESGQIFDRYPDAVDRKIRIEIAMKYIPSTDAEQFLTMVADILNSSGYEFSYYVLKA
jgi:hypothetical protein